MTVMKRVWLKISKFIRRRLLCNGQHNRHQFALWTLFLSAFSLFVIDGEFWENLERYPSVQELLDIVPNNSQSPPGIIRLMAQPRLNCTAVDSVVTIVLSPPLAVDKRDFVRNTWAKDLKHSKNPVIFAVGVSKESQQQLSNSLLKENEVHDDILLGDFQDSYYNLTLKHLVVLNWAQNCQGPKFFYTVDDDFLVFPQNLRQLTAQHTLRQNTIFCHTWINGYVNRRIWHKNYMSKKLYPYNAYPPFCRGHGRVMTADVPAKLLSVLPGIEFLQNYGPVEDVLFTGLLRLKSEVDLYSINELIPIYYNRICITTCDRPDILQIGELRDLSGLATKWNMLRLRTAPCTSLAFVISSSCRLFSDNF